MYLQVMESDYAFRSGTINPTLEENYINNKWDALVKKLNASGDGPNLSVEEWKKVSFYHIQVAVLKRTYFLEIR